MTGHRSLGYERYLDRAILPVSYGFGFENNFRLYGTMTRLAVMDYHDLIDLEIWHNDLIELDG